MLVKGYSERLPGKNFLNFDGVELWKHNADKVKNHVDTLWIITDSISHDKIEEYENVKKWQRPSLYETGAHPVWEMQDLTTSSAVVKRFIEEMYYRKDPNPSISQYGYTIEHEDIVLIQPTNPLITYSFITKCIEAYKTLKYKTLVSINQNTCKVNGNIYLFSTREAWNNFGMGYLISTNSTVAYMGTYPTINADIDNWSDYCVALALHGERPRAVNVQ